jgi:dihydrofolate reductase
MSTGAVITGRGTFEAANGWGGDHHDGVPIYVLSRNPAPASATDGPTVHYVSDVAAAAQQAKDAAGDKNVFVHGASIMVQLALTAGVLDELEIHLIPVLLGGGRRLFEHLAIEQRQLERIRVLEGDRGVTYLRYRVRR